MYLIANRKAVRQFHKKNPINYYKDVYELISITVRQLFCLKLQPDRAVASPGIFD